MRMNDLLIIGAGPAGLYAGFQAGLRNVKAVVLDALPLQGGLLSAFYPDKPIYDVPGFPLVRADHFVEQLTKQWQPYIDQVPLVLKEKIVSLSPMKDGYELTSESKAVYQSRFVMIATGSGMLSPRQIQIDDPRLIPHVHYAIPQLAMFKGKRVAILGGGDSAFDWANTLLPIAASVTVVHRRLNFRAFQNSVDTFQKSGNLLAPYELSKLEKTKHDVQLTLTQTETKEVTPLTVDEVVVCYGFIASPGTYQHWGLITSQEGILVNTTFETNLPNVFAVGNACSYPSKSKNIATGFGEVASVMETINLRLFPGRKVIYSSFLK